MNRTVYLLVTLSLSASTYAASDVYVKFEGVEGSIAGGDLFPRPGDSYSDVNNSFAKRWSTSGDADDRPTEEVAFYYTPLNGQAPTLTPGGWEIDSTCVFTYSIDMRRGNDPVSTVTGNGTAHVIGTAPLGEPRVFDTEMISFDLSGVYNGVSPFLIRESPTLASMGQATIADVGTGQYRIDSFFDVFTEMSVDGGQTWFPMVAVPEPGTMLTLLAPLGLLRRCRR